MQDDCDILIVGGGLVGATLACALANCDYRVVLLEARPLGTPGQPSYDERTVALSYSSRRIFEALGLWDELLQVATSINTIHISERGRFGVTRLHHADEDVDALGYVVANRNIGETLYKRLSAQKNLKVYSPSILNDLTLKSHCVSADVTFENKKSKNSRLHIETRVLIAADGADSRVRKQLGIDVQRDDYHQTAIVTNITTSKPHHNTAYERFTSSGPLALLPLSENRCSLVWTHNQCDVDATMQLDDVGFLYSLQECFGFRLGRFTKAGKRHAYPLSLLRATEVVRPRVALLGNAAHTLHPVAGQGLNLALRDVAVLAELLFAAAQQHDDPGNELLLKQYAAWRVQDLKRTVGFTDTLARVFTNPLAPLAHARGLGLVAVDLIKPLRKRLVEQSTGLRGGNTQLGCGLALGEYT